MDSIRETGLKGPWAVRLPEEEALSAGRLRLRAGLEVCAAGDGLWVRGPVLDDELARALRGLPGAERFRVDSQGRLTRIGRRLPSGNLPAGPWTPLATWIAPKVQPVLRAAPATAVPHAPVTLVRDENPGEPGALLCDLDDWSAFALACAEVRLRGLKFACSDDGALVVGLPVPPVRGQRLVDRGGVLVPCGHAWEPAVDAAELREVLGAATGDLVLLTEAGCDVIEAPAFVRASRSAVRLTARGVGDG